MPLPDLLLEWTSTWKSDTFEMVLHVSVHANILIAGFNVNADGGQWSAEEEKNKRCVEMNKDSQRAHCFHCNVFSVAVQLNTSLLARTALFSSHVFQVCPAEHLVAGLHTYTCTTKVAKRKPFTLQKECPACSCMRLLYQQLYNDGGCGWVTEALHEFTVIIVFSSLETDGKLSFVCEWCQLLPWTAHQAVGRILGREHWSEPLFWMKQQKCTTGHSCELFLRYWCHKNWYIL